MRKVASSILAPGTKIFVAPGEHGFSFFQVKLLTGSVSVLLTGTSLKIKNYKLKKKTLKNKNYKLKKNIAGFRWFQEQEGILYAHASIGTVEVPQRHFL